MENYFYILTQEINLVIKLFVNTSGRVKIELPLSVKVHITSLPENYG